MIHKNEFDTSEYKVTYLIGAGASANALPTVKKTQKIDSIAASMSAFAEDLKNDSSISVLNKEYVDQMVKDLYWLVANTYLFQTPDTFAKYLYLKEPNELERLKNAVSFYLTVEQFVNFKFDKRGLTFLTTVINNDSQFPTNVKILNWNFDFQIQLAGEIFEKEKFFPLVEGEPASYHSQPIFYFPIQGFNRSLEDLRSISLKEISMVHLNGIAGFYYDKPNGLILNYFYDQKPKSINEIIEKININKGVEGTGNLITFAWERDTKSAEILSNTIEVAKVIAKDTDILVIIGYSFPFFNREIDKQILTTLTASGKLKKIFYQDPIRTGEFLRKRFGLSKDIEIIHISDVDNYFIPIEL